MLCPVPARSHLVALRSVCQGGGGGGPRPPLDAQILGLPAGPILSPETEPPSPYLDAKANQNGEKNVLGQAYVPSISLKLLDSRGIHCCC